MFEGVERARGDVPRERWLRRAVELALAEARFGPGATGESGAVEQITAEEVGAELNAPRAKRGEPAVRVWVEGARPSTARVHAPNCKCPVCL
jgi:hypothetical protein